MKLLTRVEELILMAVYRLGDRAYGVPIRREVEQVTGDRFSVGAIYVPLDRLVERGLLVVSEGEPTPERGGRRKRYYRVTSAGIVALNRVRKIHETLWVGVHGELAQGNI